MLLLHTLCVSSSLSPQIPRILQNCLRRSLLCVKSDCFENSDTEIAKQGEEKDKTIEVKEDLKTHTTKVYTQTNSINKTIVLLR